MTYGKRYKFQWNVATHFTKFRIFEYCIESPLTQIKFLSAQTTFHLEHARKEIYSFYTNSKGPPSNWFPAVSSRTSLLNGSTRLRLLSSWGVNKILPWGRWWDSWASGFWWWIRHFFVICAKPTAGLLDVWSISALPRGKLRAAKPWVKFNLTLCLFPRDLATRLCSLSALPPKQNPASCAGQPSGVILQRWPPFFLQVSFRWVFKSLSLQSLLNFERKTEFQQSKIAQFWIKSRDTF